MTSPPGLFLVLFCLFTLVNEKLKRLSLKKAAVRNNGSGGLHASGMVCMKGHVTVMYDNLVICESSRSLQET